MLKNSGCFWILLCSIVALVGCSRIPDELKRAESLIETKPDSALYILKHLSPDKYKSEANRALYGLLMIKTLDKKMLPLKPIALLDSSLSYYQSHSDGNRLAACYFYKARSYKYSLQYEKAMNFYLKALDAVENKEDYTLLGKINFDMGDIYNIQRDYILARHKFHNAHAYYIRAKSQLFAFYALLYIGRTFHEAKDYKKAQIFYQNNISQAKDSIQQGALYFEMGLNFYDSKCLDSALFYLRRVINYPYVTNNRALRYYYLANLYFDLNQVDSAFQYASNSSKFRTDINIQRECYRIMTNCMYLKGKMKNMSLYMDKYVQLSDSLRKVDAQTKGSYIESIHSETREVSKTKQNLVYLLGVLLLVIVLSISVYVWKTRRAKQEKLLAEETYVQEKVGIRKEVMFKHREVLLEKIEKKKMEHAGERKRANASGREQIDLKMYEELFHLSEVHFFQKEMDTVLNNLVTKLQTRYPALNEKEINWCCLHLLLIPVADIMLLLDYRVTSLKKMKQRLAAKVQLQGAQELDGFLNNLLSE